MIPRLALLVVAVAAARVGRLAAHRLPDPLGDAVSDALAATLVVTLVLVVRPRTRPVAAAAVGFGACAAFALLRLAGLLDALASRWPAADGLLGSPASPLDLLWYAAGATLGATVGTLVLKAVGHRTPRPVRRRGDDHT